ncbi:MAG: S8 family peptidase [Eubacteriales bacterium]
MYRVRQQLECTGELVNKYQGESVTVAILDSGIFPHPDFENRIIGFKDFVNHHSIMYDDSGHGTHIAGCVASSGFVSEGRIAGIVPKARLVIGKVLNENGDGCLDDMLEGIQWIMDVREEYNIRILNISVGIGSVQNIEKRNQLIEKIDGVWKLGMTVVVAAGNKGPEPMSISPFAMSDKVIAVGCHDGRYFGKNENLCETYSGRGPSVYNIKKPDLVAPGTNIVSCSNTCKFYNRRYRNAYITKSGTSMATPLVAGAAAMLIDREPTITNVEIKRKILHNAVDMGEEWGKQGWGMLNIRKLME